MNYDIYDTQHKVEIGTKKIAIDFGNPAGTAKKLNERLPGMARKYEVKLGETGKYKARPQSTDNEINVTAVEQQQAAKFKGFRHEVGTNKINRMTIHGQIVDIPDLRGGQIITDKRYVFVYFELGDAGSARQKPLLICLSKDGTSDNQGGGKNTWYKRTGPGPTYTWENANTEFSTEDPERIGDFATNLDEIKKGLTNPPDKGYNSLVSVEIDISKTSGGGTSYYVYGNTTIRVTNQPVNKAPPGSGASSTWIGYKHSNSQGFTLKKITHSDVPMTGSGDKPLSADMSKTFNQVTAIYVYYLNNQFNNPKVIFISTSSGNHNWYTAGGSATEWADATDNFNRSDPTDLNESQLNEASATGFTPQGANYTIKLDKRPNGTGIQYRTKDKLVTVTKLVGTCHGPLPGGYVRYVHEASPLFPPVIKLYFNTMEIS